MFYDVLTRYRHRIVPFGMPVTWCARAYNGEDLAGESMRDYGACNVTAPITSVYCTPQGGRDGEADHLALPRATII